MISIEKAIPGRIYLPLRLFLNKLRGRTEFDVELVKKLIPPKTIVVDVGAHKGLYSLPLYNMGCTVYAFEPNLHCANLLMRWGARKSRANILNIGLSDVSGTAELKIPLDKNGRKHIASASICKSFMGEITSERVQLRRLDDYNLPGLSFLKVDVEGLEDNVIRGASRTIREFRPIMLIEIEERHRSAPVSELFMMMFAMGYRAFQGTKSGLQEVEPNHISDFSKLAAENRTKNFWFVHSQADSAPFGNRATNEATP